MTDHKASNRYLDQLREEVRLKQLGVKEQKKQQISGLMSVDDALTARKQVNWVKDYH